MTAEATPVKDGTPSRESYEIACEALRTVRKVKKSLSAGESELRAKIRGAEAVLLALVNDIWAELNK